MKLLSLRVQNYRSLADVELPVRDLAVVIGPNGSGKTALLEVFQLLQQGSLERLGAFLSAQGGFQAVFSFPGVKGEASLLGIELKVDAQSKDSESPMHYQFRLTPEHLGYAIAFERLEWQLAPAPEKPFQYIDRHGNGVRYQHPAVGATVRSDWDRDNPELGLSEVPRTYYEPEALRRMLAGTQHYSYLDISPRASVRLPQTLTPATRPGLNGESLYSALYNLRASYRGGYDDIMGLLSQGFPQFERLEFPVVGAGQVTIAWYEKGIAQPFYPNQLSEGTLRFLWLITTLLAPPAPALLLLDEPEVSLHPELLKLLAAVLQDASARSQIVAATHSPDLIRWLQPNEVLIADKEDGRTRFTWADELDLDDWLAEYTLRDLWLMGTLGGRP